MFGKAIRTSGKRHALQFNGGVGRPQRGGWFGRGHHLGYGRAEAGRGRDRGRNNVRRFGSVAGSLLPAVREGSVRPAWGPAEGHQLLRQRPKVAHQHCRLQGLRADRR